ncbi:hypothetical protein [Amycolatopsis sp. FDAARGOS 1241]|uniref:hypothetical protein n=1 Tax=Amycolatopsis sp. FDAARGOS 1241 TaxID=2778070 RepID=UPI00194E34B3|nr:hypothetical protein [Amycolatopsis sp. FDAARGOS 1241]QRP45017.1 hypothetical protein I6J71_38430 [Amycolatopsis sp. FDAARGOS 1241]
MTDTPGSPGPGDDAPTPSQGFPRPDPAGSSPENTGNTGGSPASESPQSPGTPESGAQHPGGQWQSSGTPASGPPGSPAPGSPQQPGSPQGAPGYQQPGAHWQSPAGGAQRPGSQWQSPGGYQQSQPVPQYPAGPYGAGPGWNPHGLGKPGVISLRPLNVGDILDGAITAIRRYPVLILGMSAVVAVLVAGLNLLVALVISPDLNRVAALGPAATQQEQLDALYSLLGSTALSLIPTLIITLLGQTFLTGFLTVVMGKAVLGRPVDFRSAWSEAAPRLLPLLAVTVLYGLATAVAAIFCLLPAVIPYVFWSLASPALVLERGTIRQAFGRSRTLVSGAFWRVLGILLLAAVIGWLISAIIGIPFDLGSGAFSGLFDPQAQVPQQTTGGLVLQSVGTVIASTIVTPFTALVTVVLYIDQRMRREGMDIELARAAGLNPPPAPPRTAW